MLPHLQRSEGQPEAEQSSSESSASETQKVTSGCQPGRRDDHAKTHALGQRCVLCGSHLETHKCPWRSPWIWCNSYRCSVAHLRSKSL